jgi:predicted AAA+ superfamily ATPase
MADKKERFALLSLFKKRYAESGRGNPNINTFAQQWAADAIIDEIGNPEARELVDYYFKINSNPSWTWFTYNWEKLIESRDANDEDLRQRKIMRDKAKEWLNS